MSRNLESRLYTGRELVRLDNKRRLMLPAGLREVMAVRSPRNLAVWALADVRNGAHYLACYDSAHFHKKWPKVEGTAAMWKTYKPDRQGRIILDAWQTEYASLEKQVIVAASPGFTNFEIWSPTQFERRYGKPSQP